MWSRQATRLLAVLAGVLCVALLAACGGSDKKKSDTGGGLGTDKGSASSSGTIKVGLLSTLEGPFAVLGEAANQGAKVALIEAGGKPDGTGPRDGVTGAKAGGKNIELVIESSDATPDSAANAARRMVDQSKVPVFVGPLSGDEGLAIKNYMKKKPNVTMLNGSSGAQNLTLRDPAPNVFRFSTDGAQWMAGLGTYAAKDLGYKKIATVAEDYSFPYDQVGGFLTEYCGNGGSVAKRIWVPLGTKDYASYVAQIPKDVNAVYVALGGADAVNFVKQFDQFTGKKLPIVGGTITVDPSVTKALGDRVEGVVSAGPVAVQDTPEYKSYAETLKKNFPQSAPPGLFDVMYYLEMKALLKSLDAVKGDVSGNQAALRAALAKQELTSPQGPVKLDANRQAIGNNYLFKVTKGQNTMLKTVPNVTQTLGQPADKYTSQPAFDRTHPSCG